MNKFENEFIFYLVNEMVRNHEITFSEAINEVQNFKKSKKFKKDCFKWAKYFRKKEKKGFTPITIGEKMRRRAKVHETD